MVGLTDLPVELLYTIVDYFLPTNYVDDYTSALNILRFSRVNRFLNDIFWKDDDFYERLWRRCIANKLPSVNKMDGWIDYLRIRRRSDLYEHWFSRPKRELPDVEPKKLHVFYFRTLRELESRPNYYTRLELAVNEEWEHVFDGIFNPADFTKERDDEYYDAYRADQEREYGFDYDYYRRSMGRRIDKLFIASIYHGNRYLMERLTTALGVRALSSDTKVDIGVGPKTNANINSLDDISGSVYNEALQKAVQYGHFDILRRLKERFSHMTHVPLITTASKYGHLQIVEYLISLGESATFYDSEPLIEALEHRRYDVARRLIELGANVSAKNNRALLHASEYGYTETVRLVIKPEHNDTIAYHQALVVASRKGYTEIVELLLDVGVNPQAPKGPSRPLYEASNHGHLAIVNLIMRKGTFIETIGVSCCAAIRKKHHEILVRLLEIHLPLKIVKKIYDVVIKERALHMIYQLAKEGSPGATSILECHNNHCKVEEV